MPVPESRTETTSVSGFSNLHSTSSTRARPLTSVIASIAFSTKFSTTAWI